MNDKRRALGRGLGALIPVGPAAEGGRPVDMFFGSRPIDLTALAETGPGWVDGTDGEHGSGSSAPAPADDVHAGEPSLRGVPGATFAELPVGSIRPNPRQPRTVFDEDDLAELVQSIRVVGMLQPVVVRPVEVAAGAGASGEYELVMGERRWRAALAAGLESVPAIIRHTADEDLLRDALLENLHRSQLNPLEEAAAYQQLLTDFGCTHEELADRIGRSRPQISNTIRLLRLPPLVARRVAAGVLSAGHARALLSLPDGAAMERMAQRIVAEGMSVRSVEEQVALGAAQSEPPARRPRAGERHPQLDDLAATLSDRLDTRVLIALGQRKGKVTIEFGSMEDLHRILAVLQAQSTDQDDNVPSVAG
ncbi:MAG TPA: ParB/RepB/Spo0J family partition protein [Dermatophilaceae bacterium]|nr:ParB/RepB/Spo0J family partition protein [Dermatophilaceae bacterium]